VLRSLNYDNVLEVDVGKSEEPYIRMVVETYRESGSGLHGDIHVRPVSDQGIPQSLRVRFPKSLRRAYPVETRFRVTQSSPTEKAAVNSFTQIMLGM
jgi:hypothetical protein